MPGVGIGIGLTINKGIRGINPDAQAYFDRVALEGGTLTALEMSRINTFVNSITLSLFDRLFIHGLQNQIAARISLANAATAPLLTEVNSPTFTAGKGYSGNGTTQYINLNYNPFNDGVNFQLNDACFGAWINTDANNGNTPMGSTTSGGVDFTSFFPRFAGEAYVYVNNAPASDPVVVASSIGLYHAHRDVSTENKLYKDGVLILTNIEDSTMIPNTMTFLLARSNDGSPAGHDTRQISLSFYGSCDVDHASFNSAVQALKSGLGW